MSYSLEIRQEAFSDVLEIVKWYDGKSSITGDAFLEELYTTLEIIKKYPSSCRLSEYGCREKQLKRFPFAIVFRIEKKKINVFAVMHIRRNPIWLKKRFKN